MEEGSGTASRITIESRSRLTVDGVIDILFFDDSQLTVMTVLGKLTVDGKELKVGELSVGSGTLTLSGKIDGLFYLTDDDQKKPFLFRRKR